MNLFQTFIHSQLFIAIITCIGTIVATLFVQRIINKRGTFAYSVNHQQIGKSADDPIFGNVVVTWKGTSMQNLYLSTIELKNESMNDYEKVIVNIYTSDTRLLSERTQILDTPNIIKWSENYRNMIYVVPGQTPTNNQWAIYNGQREYIVPVINRCQTIKITYLNSALSGYVFAYKPPSSS